MADGLKLFGDKVRAKLEAMDRNQAWLAEQIGTSPSQLSKWLNDGNQPGHPFLLRMAQTIGASINFLLDDAVAEEPRKVSLGGDIDSQIVLRFMEHLGPAEVARRIMRSEAKAEPERVVVHDRLTYGETQAAQPAAQGGRKAGGGK